MNQSIIKILERYNPKTMADYILSIREIMQEIALGGPDVLSDLFAGKMHALLCRLWKNRVKGRDWYDFIWFVRKNIPLNLKHLEARMHQSGHLPFDQKLTEVLFYKKFNEKIDCLDIDKAILDIRPFLKDTALLTSWSKNYFRLFMNEIIIL